VRPASERQYGKGGRGVRVGGGSWERHEGNLRGGVWVWEILGVVVTLWEGFKWDKQNFGDFLARVVKGVRVGGF